MSDFPEHDKLAEVKDTSQEIGSFLELMDGKGITVHKDIHTLLANYFHIDMKKLEDEKHQMLDELRGEA